MKNLAIELVVKDKFKKLVDISFDITNSIALVGQSGSGKSLTLKAILKLLPSTLDVQLNYKSSFELTLLNIGFIPQNPFTSLSPLTKIKKQFFCKEERKSQLLKLVGLDEWILDRFPSELSGGQLQRVVIAIALESNPKLLLLDEPTTALDTKSKEIVLSLLKTLQQNLDILILFVTHDILSVKGLCEDMIILKDGLIVEKGKVDDILKNPKDIYTKKLILSGFENRELPKEIIF